jgi:hypothetical protein
LEKEKISYAVVGAIAASIHGAIRASMDADVVLPIAVQQAGTLEKTLKAAGFHTELKHGDFEDPISAMLKLTDAYGNRVDLIIRLRGLEVEAFSRAIEVPFRGKTLRFAGREDFIAMKVFAGGPVDLVDARRAIAGGGSSLDMELLRKLAKGFGRDAAQALEKLLSS